MIPKVFMIADCSKFPAPFFLKNKFPQNQIINFKVEIILHKVWDGKQQSQSGSENNSSLPFGVDIGAGSPDKDAVNSLETDGITVKRNSAGGEVDLRPVLPLADLRESRQFFLERIKNFREDHTRSINPTPYKRSLSNGFFNFFNELWQEQAPVKEIR
jgi:hypothetical protein